MNHLSGNGTILFWKMVGKLHGKMKVRVASVSRHPSSRGSITHMLREPTMFSVLWSSNESQQASSLLLLPQVWIASVPKIHVPLCWSPVWRYCHGEGNLLEVGHWSTSLIISVSWAGWILQGGLELSRMGSYKCECLSFPFLNYHVIAPSYTAPGCHPLFDVMRRCSPVAD